MRRFVRLGLVAGATVPPVLLIHNVHDPIVPVEHCRRLASVIPNPEIWLTQENEAGPFGTHIKSYLLAPKNYVDEVTQFLDAIF